MTFKLKRKTEKNSVKFIVNKYMNNEISLGMLINHLENINLRKEQDKNNGNKS